MTRAFTLFDFIVILAGVVPALLLSTYLHGAWRTLVVYAGTFVFGGALWCVVFLWLVPMVRKRTTKRGSV